MFLPVRPRPGFAPNPMLSERVTEASSNTLPAVTQFALPKYKPVRWPSQMSRKSNHRQDLHIGIGFIICRHQRATPHRFAPVITIRVVNNTPLHVTTRCRTSVVGGRVCSVFTIRLRPRWCGHVAICSQRIMPLVLITDTAVRGAELSAQLPTCVCECRGQPFGTPFLYWPRRWANSRRTCAIGSSGCACES